MDRKKKLELLLRWEATMEGLDDEVNNIIALIVGAGEGDLIKSIWDIQDAYTGLLSHALLIKPWTGGDYENELEWFRYECGYGITTLMMNYDKKSVVVSDAASLLEAIEAGQ